MRRRYRHRQRYYSSRYDSDSILLAEFKFYNKTKKIISNTVLQNMENKLKNGKQLHIYWTNSEFAQNSVGFKFSLHTERRNDEDIKEVYIKIITLDDYKFSATQFNNCKRIFAKKMFITFNLTTEQKEFVENLTFPDGWYSDKKIVVVDSWENMVELLVRHRILNRYEQETDYDDYYDDMKLLFGLDIIPNKSPMFETKRRGYSSYDKVYQIMAVKEMRIGVQNYRIAFIAKTGQYDTYYGMKVVSEKSEDYNYFDTGRVFFNANDKTYFLSDNLREYRDGKLYVNMDLFKAMARNINQLLNEEERVITEPIYRFYRERAIHFDDDYRSYDNSDFSAQETAIVEQYKKLLMLDREVKVQGTIISKNKIEVIGEVFKIEFQSGFLDVYENFYSLKKLLKDQDVRFNFNALYENILKMSKLDIIKMENTQENFYKNFEEVQFTVNGMTIEVSKESNRIKVNGIFCRIVDVFHILSKVICYQSVEEFNRYVKEVSYIGVEWKKMISNGIILELNNPFYQIFKKTGDIGLEKMLLRFSLLWDSEKRNQVFLLLNNQRYLIKYKGKFKRHFDMPRRVLSMSTLKKELADCIPDLDDDVILEIVENAIEEAKIIQKRGEELVVETVKDIGAVESTINVKGAELNGYYVKGRVTGSEYFIEKLRLDVYKKVDGVWNRRCVVDDHNKQRIFEDRLANRLVNIHNEPEKIFTLFNT